MNWIIPYIKTPADTLASEGDRDLFMAFLTVFAFKYMFDVAPLLTLRENRTDTKRGYPSFL